MEGYSSGLRGRFAKPLVGANNVKHGFKSHPFRHFLKKDKIMKRVESVCDCDKSHGRFTMTLYNEANQILHSDSNVKKTAREMIFSFWDNAQDLIDIKGIPIYVYNINEGIKTQFNLEPK